MMTKVYILIGGMQQVVCDIKISEAQKHDKNHLSELYLKRELNYTHFMNKKAV